MSKSSKIFEQLTVLYEERRKLEEQIRNLENTITDSSIYNFEDMRSTIAKLISFFEDEEYVCDDTFSLFHGIDKEIKAKNKNVDSMVIFIRKETKIDHAYSFSFLKDGEAYFIPERSKEIFEVISVSKEISDMVNDLISNFLYYLLEERLENEEIDLSDTLEKYLEQMDDLKEKYQAKRKHIIGVIQERKIRQDFENSCMVELNSMFVTMCHIAKHYDKINSKILIVTDNGYKSKRLIIGEKTYNKIMEVEVLPDPDDYGPSWYKKTQNADKVNFYELKNAFDIEKFNYLKIFLENLEKNFINGAEFLDANIIQEELIEISNICKNK